MTKKPRKRLGVTSNRVWSDADFIQLLAWLDYCLQHKIKFKATAVGHLKRVTQKEFSLRQMHDKLYRAWKRYGSLDVKKVNDIYSQGTSCIVGLTEEEKRAVREAICQLNDHSARYELRSTSSALRSRSHTLSIVRQTSEESSLSIHATPEFEDVILCQGFQNAGFAFEGEERTAGKVDTRASRSPAPLSLGRATGQEINHGGCHPRIKGETGPEVESFPHSGPPLSAEEASLAHAQNVSTGEDEESRIKLLEQEVADKTKDLAARQTEILRQQNQLFSLENRLSAAQKECKEISHCTRVAGERYGDQDVLGTVLYENSVLKKALKDIHILRRNAALANAGHLGPLDSDIRKDFALIEADIADALSSPSIETPSLGEVQNHLQQHALLDTLAHRISGWNFIDLLSYSSERDALFEILRSLVAAGLCALVFETPFPDFTVARSPLLDQYRKHILTQEGPKALQQLDLLAHESLISEDYFQTCVVMDKAKLLANKLFRALSPFLVSDSQAITLHGASQLVGHTSPLESQPELSLEGSFQDILIRALTLKLKLLLSGKRYRLVFFNPGDAFNSETMHRDGWTYDGYTSRGPGERDRLCDSDNSGGDIMVKLCLFPALYSWSAVDGAHDSRAADDVESCVVEYNNFITEGALEDAQEPVLVVKAVVLV